MAAQTSDFGSLCIQKNSDEKRKGLTREFHKFHCVFLLSSFSCKVPVCKRSKLHSHAIVAASLVFLADAVQIRFQAVSRSFYSEVT